MPNCRFRDQEWEELALLGPPHPGEILREDIWPQLKMSKKAAAKKMNVSHSAISNLLNERRRISRHLAGLAEISGISVIYWLVLQAHHDAWQMERGEIAAIQLEQARVGVLWGATGNSPVQAGERKFKVMLKSFMCL